MPARTAPATSIVYIGSVSGTSTIRTWDGATAYAVAATAATLRPQLTRPMSQTSQVVTAANRRFSVSIVPGPSPSTAYAPASTIG